MVYNTRRKQRILLARIERLREIGAPIWVIKWEQAHLAIARSRRKAKRAHKAALYERHVYPRLAPQ
jgi:hypothetical protein